MRSKPWFSRAWLGLGSTPSRQSIPTASSGFQGQVEELEARILFSADAAGALIDPSLAPVANDTGSIQQILPPTTADQQQAAPTTQTSASASSTELVFVDARVPDAQTLIAQIVAQQDGQHTLEIHWLDATQDGIDQISDTLQGRQDISSIHLISHGSDGNVQMGSTWLNEGTLPAYLGQLTSWQSALTQDADILIYGCDVAQTAQGQRFVNDLALLTGADVAASDDKTGAAALGANWDLEYRAGVINAPALLGDGAPQWNHILATVTLRDGLNGYTGTTDTYLALLAPITDYSTSTTLSAGRSTTQDPFQTLFKFENLTGTGANQVPQGSVVTSVSLTLYMTASPTFTNPTFSLYRMLSAWTDTSTYSSMGSGVDGSEYRATEDFSFADNGTGAYSFTFSTAGHAMINTVQAWLNDPSSNQGWYLFCNDNSSKASFASSEDGTAANRPTLAITYSLPSPPSLDLDANNSSGATGSNYTAAFTEQTPIKIADTDATVTAGVNAYNTNLSGMTVTLTNPLDGAAESLTATTTGTNITAAYNSGTGVLTLSGSDTAANYQTVLRSILYNNTSDNPNTTNRSITIVATDPYGGNSATATTTLSVTRVNDAPVITSNGGGATASISLAETLSAVTTVTSTDAEGTARSYSIVAGGDGAKFSINSSTGVLTFVSAPDFEAPTDSNADNVYVVTVQASDGSLSDTQTISVTVTDVSSALVVTTNADTNDSGLGSAFTAEQLNAVTGGSDGKVSLREAIIAANNTAGTDTISFAITGATGSYGEYTITATSALPTVTQAVNIDASTQSGYVAGGVHTVVLDGNDAAAYGLDLSGTADGSTIRGLVIRNFTSYGIYVEAGSDNNTIVGNFIGSFNADGSNKGTGFGNATAGLYVRGANTVIGGTTAADRNVISGNPGGYNIYLTTNADGTTIKGNYIGLNAAGTSVFSSTNPNYGIMIETSATNVTIGGSASGSGNVISGHVREGIWVTTTGAVTVQGNYIGTDLTGTVDLGNTRYGIYLDDTGTATIAGNLISGNDLGGIYASNNSVTVQGNIIGLNAAGTAKLANTGSGIELRTSATSTIGGNGSSYRNVISGNTAYGIDIETAPTGGHVIKGNYIGVGVDGSTLLGNSLAGIYVNAGNSTIGGKTAGDGNLIAGNGGAGIAVASGTGTLYYRNAIYSNTGLGIDLGNDGVTVNDYNDGDGGANYQNNFPVITSVVTNGSTTTIQGSIDFYSGGETIYIELYGSPSADATGYGEGRTYLGSVQVVTTATTGDATFSLTVAGVSVGDWVTAVANIETSYIGASEFSKAVQAVAPANAPRGKVIWNNNDRFFQYYADWSTGGFSGVGTDGLYLTDDISMITAAEAPTRNEIIFIGSADASGKILAAIWNGSTWSSIMSIPLANPSASASNYDSFAVAYDQVSGDAMLVWDNGNTGTTGLSYATWNGSSWSAINTITAPVSGEPLHMKLATRPGSHEMMLAVETNAASNNQYAIVWNGSSWGNAQTLGTNTNEQYFELNVAYEQQSGRAMVVYDNSASNAANVQYRIWNGSSWGSEGTITAPAGITGTADLYSTAMASDPNSNRLALAAKNANDEIWLAVWDGSSWGSTQVATTTGHSMPEDHPSMSVAFESQSGDLLAAYGKSSGPNVYYRTWTSGAGWSAENTGPSIGGTDIPYIVKLYADPYSNTIMMGVQDNAYDLNFAAWDGSAWGTVTELDNDTVFYYRENFTYVWYQNAALLSNLSGDTLAYTEDQSATVIDQGTAATATMGDESLYNGANLTVSFTAGSTSSEDVLGIRNQGSGAGQIGLSGSNVSYGGTVIGTYSGGSAGASLVITLNANASNAAVTALARNITYQNTNTSTPSTSSRTARFLLTNALGQASNYSDVTITVTATNDAPVNTVPGAQSVNEDTTLVFSSGNSNLISIADVDAASSNVQVTLTVTNGTLTLSGTSGLSFSTGDGTADTTMTFTGTVSAINTALAGMGYSPTANYNGAASLTILTSDLGNTGSGGTLTDSDTVAITVNAVNDAPVNSVPTAQTTNEDTSLTFSSGNGNLISIADVDAGSSNLQVTLTVTNGTLTLSGLTGLSFTSGDGSADATMTFTGTASAINTALAGLVYAPTANYNGSDTLTIVTSDLGNTGSGGTRTDTDTVAITVTAVNDAPVNTVPAAQSVNEDSTLTFSSGNSNLISIADVDAGSGSMQVTISVSHGALTLSGTTGLSFTSGDGTADTTMTFTGTASAINTALAGLVYAPTANYNGSDTLTILTSDQGNAGSGGARTDTDTVAITVNALNDAPVNTVPAAQSVNEDGTLTFSTGNGNRISVADVDAGSGNMQATLTVTNGTLTLSGTSGLSFSTGDGTADATMTFTGTASAINAALAGLVYAPTANYNGSDTLTILTSDLGNTGSGGTLTDSDTVAITVNAVNDAPSATITPISYNATEQVSLALQGTGLNISDIDAGSGNVQATLSVTSGTLSVSVGSTGVSVSGSSTSTVTLSGTLTQINNLLAGNGGATLSYLINSDAPPASDTLTLLASDLGNTGSGGTLTSADTATIYITAVNDAPTVTITAPSYTVVEAQSVMLHNTGLSVSDPDGNGTSVQVTISADIGILTISAGSTGVSVGNSGTGSVTLTGTVSQINSLLLGNGGATIAYLNNSGTPTASATLTLGIDDLGNTGGGNLTASANVAINVVPAAAMGSVGIPGVAPGDISAYYGFDASANLGRDDTAGGHDMALIGTPTAETGHDGRTSAIGVTNDETGAAPQTGGNIAGLSTGGAMTVSLWVRFDAFNNASGGNDRIIDFGQAGATGIGNIVLARDATTQRISFILQHDNVTEDICTTGITDVVQTGQWAHIAATVDASGNMRIYFNGTLSGSFSGTALASGVRTNNYIAQSNTAGTYGMNGAIDDLLLVSRAMTAGEIATLYNQANGFSVHEKAGNGTSVGTVVDGSSIDGRTVTYSLTNSAAGRFAINSSTGEITVADGANLLYADASHYTLTVRATDSGGFALDTNYTVNLLNINDAPVGTDHTVAAVEDTPYVFGTSDFGFTDPSDPGANALLAVKITSVPASGSLTLNGVAVSANDVVQASDIAAGKLQFTAAAHANGTGYASFAFKVQDDGGTAHGGTDMDATARTMTIDVASVNDAPQGSDKTVTTLEDTPYVFTNSDFGFSDVDGNAFLAVKITSVPGAGSLTLNGVAVSANDVILASDIAAGRLQLAPATNAHGAGYSSFTFKVQDDGGTANGGVNLDASDRTMTLDVTPVNDAPSGTDKTLTISEDTGLVFSASDFGFTDPDDSPANSLQAVKLTTLPASGTLTLNGSAVSVGQFVSVADINAGLLVFNPAANDNGTAYATLGFQVQDTGGTANGGLNLDASTRTLTINVTAVNDAPTTQDESVSGNEDSTITGAVSGADVEGSSLSFGKGSDPTHGSVSVAANGNFSYTPGANYNGTDSFTVTVSDGQGGTATSTVTVTINAVNDAPTTTNLGVSGNEDTLVTGQVTASDVDGDPLSFSKASDPAHGSVTVNSDGSFSYTPTANYNGTDSFTVSVADGQGGTSTSTVNITITPVNDLPTTSDVNVSGNEDSAISGQVTGSDVDGNPLSYTKASDPTHGSVSVAANGNFVYTPNANYNGTDSFTVTVSDGQGGTATATVNVTVAAVNDAPTVDNPGVVGAEDTTITGQVTGADVDGDTLSYTRTSNPVHGSVIVNSDGSFSYTPAANFHGSDSFTVTVSDGQGGSVLSTVSITVTPVNDAPTSNNPSVSGAEDTVITGAITASDVEGDTLSYQVSSDPAHGQVTVASDGSFSYTPTANYNGTDSFTVLVSDGQGGTTTSTVSVSITPLNDAPATQNVTASGAEDTAITGQVTASDVDGNPLSYTKGSDPTHGSVTVQANGSFSYTPAANYNGTDSFTVTVTDGQGGSATSTVSITVTAINDAPVSSNVALSGAEDTTLTGQITGSDVDGDTLNYAQGSNPAHGSVTVQTDGRFSYTPAANFSGSDSFTVTVSDGQGGSTTSTVSITVTPVNDAPITYNIAASGAEDTAITGQVAGSDADGDALSYTKGSDPTHGSVNVNSDGSFSYTPTANYSGSDSFTVTVSDGQGGTATSTITITVTPVNDAPVTSDVTASVVEDSSITGQVTGSDAEGDTLSYAKGSDPTHGSVTVNTDGSFSYTPTANYNGTDSFTVTVSDGQGGTATATVTITVTALNDVPVMNNVSLTGAEDTSFTGLLIGNDADGDTLSYAKGSDPAHGSVSVGSNGSFNYTPTANYNGADSFTVTVSDGHGGTATATITLTVTPVNDAPVTSNMAASVPENGTVTGQVTGSDVEGDTLSYAKGSDPTHGSVTVQADGSFSYTPLANFKGTDLFTVTVLDGQGGTATSTVSISVTPVDTTPAVPVVPISPPPASTDNTNSGNAADNTPPDSANTPATKTAPDTTDPAPSSSEAMAGSVATPAQAPAAESDAPATALHDRVQTGAWLGGRVPDNSAMGRQILFDGVSRDYLTPANGSANNGNSPVIQLLNLILPTLERAQDINLMLTPLSGVTHALPEQATADNTGAAHDEGLGQHIRLTKVASYSTGLGLSIGTIWWTARISGLVTSALISTPAWRSLDPLPVVTSPSDDPDQDEDGDSRLGDREVEHLFDGDKPIEQDMPVIQ